MIYVALDTETTGLSEKCSLIELAMVLEDTAKVDASVEALPFFHCYVKQPEAHWESYALGMHMGKAQLAAQTWPHPLLVGRPIYTMAEAEHEALTWLAIVAGITPDAQGTVAGKNYGTFDRRFLPTKLAKAFNRRYIDPASVLINWSAKELPSMKDLLGAEPDHNALADARAVVHVLRRAYAL